VRARGLAYGEAAELLSVAPWTVQRRLERRLWMLTEQLGNLGPTPTPSDTS
jgi:DNA-directed RNA polymerase specialized sigma24 family protein